MSKVVELFEREQTADEILESAKGTMKDVFVFGYDKDGSLITTGTNLTRAELLYMLESFKHRMFSQ